MREIVCSGFGGQGVLTVGLIMVDIAIKSDMYATWIPSYGAEMRGGKAYCVAKIDPVRVGSPNLEEADIVLAMNIPSLAFSEEMKSGGTLIVNTDMIDDLSNRVTRSDINILKVPFEQLARSINNPKGANVIAAGVITALMSDELDRNVALNAILSFFEKKGKASFNEKNRMAFEIGYDFVETKGE